MQIPHLIQLSRSRFFGPVHTELARAERPLHLSINLATGGGYAGEIEVEIRDQTEREFVADLELRDCTRFPARIRAAATALRDRGLLGRFRVSHYDGGLVIVEL